MTSDAGGASDVTGCVALADGRTLAFAEYGAPDGVPVVFMHGIPSSRLGAGLIDEVAQRCNVRLIAPDRPGYGASDPRAGRTILDCVEDITALADALGLDQFGLIGISGALPYVLACTVTIPERLTRVAILSGLAPLNAPGVLEGANPGSIAIYQLAMRSPRLAAVWMKMLAGTARRSPGVVYKRQLSHLPPADRELFEAAGMRERRIADLAEAFRQGTAAASAEAVLHVNDWGFAFADVPVEVLLWQGTKDRLHPLAMGRYLEGVLPGCRAIYAEGAGAFGFINQMDVIFESMFGHRLEQVPVGRPSNG